MKTFKIGQAFGRVVSLAFILGLLALVNPAQAQSSKEVGAAPGLSAFEFVGQIDQNALDITAYGYLTHINGLPDDQLFNTPDPTKRTEATARFTFTATGKLTGRYTVQNLIVTDTVLTLTIHITDAPAGDFAKPDSFSAGSTIAAFAVRYQQILIVTAPNTGDVIGSGESTQQASSAFTLNNQQYQLGHEGLMVHVTSDGSGKRTDATAPKSQFAFAGSATVIAGLSK